MVIQSVDPISEPSNARQRGPCVSDNDNVDASVIFVNLAHLSLRNGDINDDNMEIAAAIMWASRSVLTETVTEECPGFNQVGIKTGIVPTRFLSR